MAKKRGVESAREKRTEMRFLFVQTIYTHTHTDEVTTHTHTHLACMQKFRFLLRVANWSKRQLAISNWGMARKKTSKTSEKRWKKLWWN